MERPTGVTILAVVAFVSAAGLGVLGLFFCGLGNPSQPQGDWSGLAGLGLIGGIVCLGAASLLVATGIGFLMLQNWSRRMAVLGAWVVLAVFILSTVRTGLMLSMAAFFSLMPAAIAVWILIYLSKPDVKRAFGGGSV
ncbi:MAG TPA: hypothetical protein VKG84_05950 [Candidatus Acidoferrales bacterium]|nr:hypothetical protein [Candidatus Acidoferrales bacterium]